MSFLACGINHQTAPIALREQVVFSSESMPAPLLSLVQDAQLEEAAILSTCNRTEIYCTSHEPKRVVDWLHQHKRLTAEQLTPHIYLHHDQAAVRHMLRVASGLDSMVLGEPQILGQIKNAFSLAQAAGTLGTHLNRLFQYVFSSAKRVRSETAIGAQPVSVAFAAVNLAKHIFADVTKLSVLLIGAGETIELVARHLQTAGITRFYVANRTVTHAQKFVETRFIASLDKIADYLPQADMVVAATASMLPLVKKNAVQHALKIRKRRPMLMVDLAVPRNIESSIAELDDVYLYTLDDLQNIIQQNQQHRRAAADKAEAIIDAQAAHYMQTLKMLEAAPLISAYRDQAEQLRDAELQKALRLLQTGMPAEEVLQRLAQQLTNKLLHAPTIQLREAAYKKEVE
jgi:glutamyl-tRNA reductase